MTCQRCHKLRQQLEAERSARWELHLELKALHREAKARRTMTKVRYKRWNWLPSTQFVVRWYGPGREIHAHRFAERVLNEGGLVEIFTADVGRFEEVETW